MSDIESTSPKPADSGALLGSLLSNPDLIRNISSLIGSSGSGGTESNLSVPQPPSPSANNEAVADGISRVLSNPEMMAKLPDVMKMLAPMVQQAQVQKEASVPAIATPSGSGAGRDRHGCRNDLLLALKPFLSPERCRTLDAILQISQLGSAARQLL